MYADLSKNVLILRDAQQFSLSRRAVRQPTIAILAHRAHSVVLRRGANFRLGRLVVDLRTNLVRGQQELINTNPSLITGMPAFVASNRVPQLTVMVFAVRAEFTYQPLRHHAKQ